MGSKWMVGTLLGALALLGCGSDGLSENDVTNIPPGDAVGMEHAGMYELEAVTVACAGSCAPVNAFGLIISPCDVGARNNELAEITQVDGSLQVDLEDVLWASRLEGGVWNDGSFEVGGIKTELGGQIRFIAHSTGVLSGGTWTSDLELRSVGTIDDQSRDCTATVEVTGTRL